MPLHQPHYNGLLSVYYTITHTGGKALTEPVTIILISVWDTVCIKCENDEQILLEIRQQSSRGSDKGNYACTAHF
jgi:hypothetical protein